MPKITTEKVEPAFHKSGKCPGLLAPHFPHLKINEHIIACFAEFIPGLRPANQPLYDIFTHSFLAFFFLHVFVSYSPILHLITCVKTAFQARPEIFQSWVLWLNYTQDFYQKKKKRRHKQKKKRIFSQNIYPLAVILTYIWWNNPQYSLHTLRKSHCGRFVLMIYTFMLIHVLHYIHNSQCSVNTCIEWPIFL